MFSHFTVLINWSHLEPLFHLYYIPVQGIWILCMTLWLLWCAILPSLCISCNWVQPNDLFCTWRCRQCYSQCVRDKWNNFTRCHHNPVNSTWWLSYRWDHSSQKYCTFNFYTRIVINQTPRLILFYCLFWYDVSSKKYGIHLHTTLCKRTVTIWPHTQDEQPGYECPGYKAVSL